MTEEWDVELRGARYDSRGAYFNVAYTPADQTDTAPLLSEEAYIELPSVDREMADHCHWQKPPEPPSAVPQLVIALILCAIFMVCEMIGGYKAGSLAIMSDAAHLLGDCGGFGLALLAFKMGAKPADGTHSYGYRRAEVLGAMASVLLLWTLTALFVYEACARIYTNEYELDADDMLIVSGAGVVVNVAMALVLHGACTNIAHHHSHGGAACSQQQLSVNGHPASTDSDKVGPETRRTNGILQNGGLGHKPLTESASAPVHTKRAPPKNINLRAALVHVIGDLIQSCGVLLAALVIKFYPSAQIVDPICTFVFSAVVVVTTVHVVKDAFALLMQATPSWFRYKECVAALSAVAGVRQVHTLHAWALSSHDCVLTAHIAIDEFADHETVLRSCQAIVKRDFRVNSATFQVERYTEQMRSCVDCISQPDQRQ